MSNTAKVCWCLSCMDENQLVTDVEFFHWLRPVFRLIVVVLWWSYCGVDVLQKLFANFQMPPRKQVLPPEELTQKQYSICFFVTPSFLTPNCK